MISFKKAHVKEIVSERTGITKIEVEVNGRISTAINYDQLSGEVKVGDTVIINTKAVELKLGSGGAHFVLWNLKNSSFTVSGPGHLMKLRYTPMQFGVLSAEEPESPYHEQLRECKDLEKMPVIAGELHSQLPAIVTAIKEVDSKLKIAYIMTDGAALPIVLSDLVEKLKELELIDTTITCGQAFGGDFETINIYSALAIAKKAAGADIAVAVMGPGIAGTGTLLGYSGIEQGAILNAVSALNGKPIAVVRLHFADKRDRHYGVSHHSLTSLGIAALAKSDVVLPGLSEDKRDYVLKQLDDSGISSKHRIVEIDAGNACNILKGKGMQVTTMGRTIDEEPDFFRAAAAAGIYAVNQLGDGN